MFAPLLVPLRLFGVLRHSQMFFAHLTKEEVELVADTPGSVPYFAIQPSTWYQGDRMKSMLRVLKALVKKCLKVAWVVFTYCSLFAMLCPLDGLFGDECMIYIQILGPSEMLVGVSKSGLEILHYPHVQLSSTVGLLCKVF